MELAAAAALGKFIGAGLAGIGSGASAIGVGYVAGNFLSGALRNPSAAGSQTATLFIGLAFAEALGIFSFLVALLLLFALLARRLLDEYLLFHYGAAQEVLP